MCVLILRPRRDGRADVASGLGHLPRSRNHRTHASPAAAPPACKPCLFANARLRDAVAPSLRASRGPIQPLVESSPLGFLQRELSSVTQDASRLGNGSASDEAADLGLSDIAC